MDFKPHKTIIIRLFRYIRVILPIILVIWLVTMVDWNSMLPILHEASYAKFFVSLGFLFLAYIPVTTRWQYLLSVKGLNLSFLPLWKYVLISLFASNFLPTTIGGDIVKIVGVMKDAGEKKSIAGASVVADRIYNMLPMAILLPFSVAIFNGGLGNFLPLNGKGKEGSSLFSLTSLPIADFLIQKIRKVWRAARDWFLIPKVIAYSVALSFISNSFGFLSAWFVFKAIGLEITYWQSIAIIVISYFITIIPISFNGIGIQEGSISYLLVLLGAGTDQAIAAALLLRIVIIAVSLTGGVWLIFGGQGLLTLARQLEIDKTGMDGDKK